MLIYRVSLCQISHNHRARSPHSCRPVPDLMPGPLPEQIRATEYLCSWSETISPEGVEFGTVAIHDSLNPGTNRLLLRACVESPFDLQLPSNAVVHGGCSRCTPSPDSRPNTVIPMWTSNVERVYEFWIWGYCINGAAGVTCTSHCLRFGNASQWLARTLSAETQTHRLLRLLLTTERMLRCSYQCKRIYSALPTLWGWV